MDGWRVIGTMDMEYRVQWMWDIGTMDVRYIVQWMWDIGTIYKRLMGIIVG